MTCGQFSAYFAVTRSYDPDIPFQGMYTTTKIVFQYIETFYFTELAAYVHKELAGVLSSFVIVPQGAGSVFGDMFEYTPNTDELTIPDVDVDDIDIIENITDANIKAGS